MSGYVERYNSAEIIHDLFDGKTAERTFKEIPYATWNTAAVSLRDAHPADASMICYRLRMKPHGQPSAGAYDNCEVTAYYKQIRGSDLPPTEGGSASNIDLDFSYENFTINGNITAGTASIANKSITVPTVTVSIIQTTTSLNSDIPTYVYRVNSDTITIKTLSFEAKQVRYEGCKARNEFSVDDPDAEIYYYTHQFRCICASGVTWNMVPVADEYGAITWEETSDDLFEPVAMQSFMTSLEVSQGT